MRIFLAASNAVMASMILLMAVTWTPNHRNVAVAFPTVPVLSTRSASSQSFASSTALGAATLYGHPGTRSPLVNWGALEVDFDLQMAKDLSQNPHPFGQIPCLVDDGDVILFESGAILQYIHSQTNAKLSPATQAAVMSWITWANASLDPILFLETPEGKVYDTGLKRPQKRIDQLNAILSKSKYLTGDDQFTLADVAVSSYLLYVVQFFRGMGPILSKQGWTHVKRYMKDCAARPAYAQAFGANVQAYVLEELSDGDDDATTEGDDGTDKKKKLFGMF